MAGTSPSTGNLLLDTLAPDAFEALDIRDEHHTISTVLITADERPPFLFFPYPGAVVSIVRATENGSMVESGVIGAEGVLAVQTILTPPAPIGSDAIVQIEGRFGRVERARLQSQFRDNEPFRDTLLAFTSLFLEQVTQNLVCNRLHAIEQRLAKWLLIVRDRIDTDRLQLTHEFLAHMLGVHRPGVSIAVGALELDGIVRHSRQFIEIRDRAGLLERSCECYAVVREARAVPCGDAGPQAHQRLTSALSRSAGEGRRAPARRVRGCRSWRSRALSPDAATAEQSRGL